MKIGARREISGLVVARELAVRAVGCVMDALQLVGLRNGTVSSADLRLSRVSEADRLAV
jgi:hypothetical protein